MVKYKTYSNAFKWKMVLYSINDMKLPFALVTEQIVYFFTAFFVMLILYGVFHITIINVLCHFLLFPGIFTYGMMNLNPEDKKPLVWIIDFFKHHLKDPKEQWNFQPPEHHEEGRFDSVAFRR